MRARLLKILAALAGVCAVVAVVGVTVARSDWAREKVRTKIVEVLERSTGGKATLEDFDYQWASMTATVRGLTLRGKETADQAPLFKVDAVTVAIDVRSWIGKDIELRELSVEKPEVHIYVAEDGSTNVPGTGQPSARNPIEQLLELEIGKLRIANGLFEYDSKRIPMNITAQGLRTVLSYVRDPEHYAFQLSAGRLKVPGDVEMGVDFEGRLLANRVEFKGGVQLADGKSTAQLDGALDDFKSPRAKAAYTLSAPATELRVSALRGGAVTSTGTVTWNGDGAYEITGDVRGANVAVEADGFAIRNVNVTGAVRMTPERIDATGVKANGFGGSAAGSVSLEHFKLLRASGKVDAPVSVLMAMTKNKPLPWDGMVAAPFEFSGEIGGHGIRNATASADATLAALPEQLPAEGRIAARWDQDAGTVTFEPSSIRAGDVAANFMGTLGKRMEVGVFATGVASFEPYVRLISGDDAFTMPFRMDRGQISLSAVVTGPVAEPGIEGSVSAAGLIYEDMRLGEAESEFSATSSELVLRKLRVTQEGATATGEARIGLAEWKPKPNLPVSATLSAKSLDLQRLARLAGANTGVAGKVNAQLTAKGTFEAPQAVLNVGAQEIEVAGERLTKVSGEARTVGTTQATWKASAVVAGAPVTASGEFQHKAHEWDRGTLSVSVEAAKLRLQHLEFVKKARPGVEALAGIDATAEVAVSPDGFQIRKVDGWAEAQEVRDSRYLIGGLRVESTTQDGTAQIQIKGNVGQSVASGQASIRLANDYPGAGRVSVTGLPLDFAASYIATIQKSEPMPVVGSLDADLRWRGPLKSLDEMSGIVTVSNLSMRKRDGDKEMTLTNASPLQFEIDRHAVQIRSARFRAKETTFTVAGLYSFGSKSPWDMSVSGVMNLGVLSTFEKDLTAGGIARVTANIRGESERPLLSGRMVLENGSVFLKGMPNGIEKANGTIFFERDRATIETFEGITGGGQFSMSGFIGFGGDEFSYRLQAKADRVRVRYPEGVSTTLDADLSLTGSSNAALLSGTATIQRSGFSSQGDLGSYIAGSANPIPVPSTQNEFLRNLQFDVRVRAASDATFQTDYTQDIQLEADLKVRGSPAKPVVLGNVRVNQGEVDFFGNRYTISRGEIVFFNTVTLQPSINLDLETRIRGVTVYININGPLSRLNVNYRSEPPLQSSEILALLTVGRQPTATSGNVPRTNVNTSANQPLGDAGNTLLGGALSASVSSRVERFFGASRIKIDPNSTGVENIPQARLTVEQSLSRDITLTYSTNLSRTSQQIIRMEWNFSKEWSALAVRDENGSFGLDFLFRKRFK